MDDTTETQETDRASQRSPVRAVPLVFGLAFCAIGVSALVLEIDDIDLDVAWLWALALAVLGVGGLVATLEGIRRSRRASG